MGTPFTGSPLPVGVPFRVSVTTTVTLGSHPLLPSGGSMVDPGSNQGLLYMVYLMQQMLHGMQGKPQYSYPVNHGFLVHGYVIQPPVPVTGVVFIM